MRTYIGQLAKYRQGDGWLKSDESLGWMGAFHVPCPATKTTLLILCGTDFGWEHVSVSTKSRCPTWDEMCFVKDLFWDDEEAVVQYHPPKSSYVNVHPFVLHLWRCTTQKMPCPPLALV